ncbi:MAG: hypothetical protein ACOYW3_07090 [Bacteroidota bacterium]
MKKNEKYFLSFLVIWSFIQTWRLIIGYSRAIYDQGEPFSGVEYLANPFYSDAIYDEYHYDFSEFFLYVGGGWLVFFLLRFLNINSILFDDRSILGKVLLFTISVGFAIWLFFVLVR